MPSRVFLVSLGSYHEHVLVTSHTLLTHLHLLYPSGYCTGWDQ